ncbi:quinone oxidoreductase family protein [Phytomonospora endophytica]|uniref:NADPH2:quinone reductase n=1 Tax=Phytomonospora endophytica TaxID=714109 RepID=A0A841FRN2_9ACTN|nr:quinone oxidoreductase [Phytomonospora endophytica]MBB6036428.1 NADPH2:quinone reductase [Phytomonospora endophytica]GIG65751.1 alcohol dehydrogenase [Phytomonospora endophytica]
MRAVVVHEAGNPEVLAVAEHPDPVPAPGEALVRVAAAGVNYIDVAHCAGTIAVPGPFVPGVEGSGTLLTATVDLPAGARVAWAMPRGLHEGAGGYAEKVAVPVAGLVPVPDGITLDTAAAALMHGLTAHYLTHSVHAVRPGDTVLVHAAAGGLGLTLTQVARIRGARVIGTTSTSEKAAIAEKAGAEVVGYEDFAAEARRRTDGAGVAAVYDGVGAVTFDGGLAALRRRGTYVLLGTASGPVAHVDPARLLTGGSLMFTRPGIIDFIADREELLARANDVFGWLAEGLLDVHVGARLELDHAAEAHRALEERRTIGKTLLIP